MCWKTVWAAFDVSRQGSPRCLSTDLPTVALPVSKDPGGRPSTNIELGHLTVRIHYVFQRSQVPQTSLCSNPQPWLQLDTRPFPAKLDSHVLCWACSAWKTQVLALQISKSWTNCEVFGFLQDFWKRLCTATEDATVDDRKREFIENFRSQVTYHLLRCSQVCFDFWSCLCIV